MTREAVESDAALEQEPLRVGVVCSDPLRLLGLRALAAEWQVRLSGGDTRQLAAEVLTGAGPLRTDDLSLVVVDAASVPSVSSLISAFQGHNPALKVLVIGLESSPEYVGDLVAAGARGYLTHQASERELRMALEVVLDGSVWAPRKVLARLLDQERRRRAMGEHAALTPRETDVLHQVTEGRSNRETGAALQIEEATVKAHVGRLMRKLGVKNRTALVVRARELGLAG